eukprot:m.846272 g.846272  ORF g.846272 m.846272 type:complete len:1161 (-) comp59558_c0_seq1:461-3943(-)
MRSYPHRMTSWFRGAADSSTNWGQLRALLNTVSDAETFILGAENTFQVFVDNVTAGRRYKIVDFNTRDSKALEVKTELIPQVFEALTLCAPELLLLSFSRNALGNRANAFRLLIDLLGRMPALRYLDLRYNLLTSADVIRAVARVTTLEYLCLQGNTLNNTFAPVIAGIVNACPRLQRLLLAENKFTHVADAAFAPAFATAAMLTETTLLTVVNPVYQCRRLREYGQHLLAIPGMTLNDLSETISLHRTEAASTAVRLRLKALLPATVETLKSLPATLLQFLRRVPFEKDSEATSGEVNSESIRVGAFVCPGLNARSTSVRVPEEIGTIIGTTFGDNPSIRVKFEHYGEQAYAVPQGASGFSYFQLTSASGERTSTIMDFFSTIFAFLRDNEFEVADKEALIQKLMRKIIVQFVQATLPGGLDKLESHSHPFDFAERYVRTYVRVLSWMLPVCREEPFPPVPAAVASPFWEAFHSIITSSSKLSDHIGSLAEPKSVLARLTAAMTIRDGQVTFSDESLFENTTRHYILQSVIDSEGEFSKRARLHVASLYERAVGSVCVSKLKETAARLGEQQEFAVCLAELEKAMTAFSILQPQIIASRFRTLPRDSIDAAIKFYKLLHPISKTEIAFAQPARKHLEFCIASALDAMHPRFVAGGVPAVDTLAESLPYPSLRAKVLAQWASASMSVWNYRATANHAFRFVLPVDSSATLKIGIVLEEVFREFLRKVVQSCAGPEVTLSDVTHALREDAEMFRFCGFDQHFALFHAETSEFIKQFAYERGLYQRIRSVVADAHLKLQVFARSVCQHGFVVQAVTGDYTDATLANASTQEALKALEDMHRQIVAFKSRGLESSFEQAIIDELTGDLEGALERSLSSTSGTATVAGAQERAETDFFTYLRDVLLRTLLLIRLVKFPRSSIARLLTTALSIESKAAHVIKRAARVSPELQLIVAWSQLPTSFTLTFSAHNFPLRYFWLGGFPAAVCCAGVCVQVQLVALLGRKLGGVQQPESAFPRRAVLERPSSADANQVSSPHFARHRGAVPCRHCPAERINSSKRCHRPALPRAGHGPHRKISSDDAGWPSRSFLREGDRVHKPGLWQALFVTFSRCFCCPICSPFTCGKRRLRSCGFFSFDDSSCAGYSKRFSWVPAERLDVRSAACLC